MDARRKMDFVRRYLSDQEARLDHSPDDAEITSEIQRARELLAHLESSLDTGSLQ